MSRFITYLLILGCFVAATWVWMVQTILELVPFL